MPVDMKEPGNKGQRNGQGHGAKGSKKHPGTKELSKHTVDSLHRIQGIKGHERAFDDILYTRLTISFCDIIPSNDVLVLLVRLQ